MKLYIYGVASALIVIAAVNLTGCNNNQDDTSSPANTQSDQQSAAAQIDTTQTVSKGSIEFTVDGVSKQYPVLVDAHSFYTKFASKATFKPAPDANEELAIQLLSGDLKAFEYPADFPGARQSRGASGRPVAMSMMGITYVEPDGSEWSGTATVQLQSFSSGGVLTGSFERVELPHVDKVLPDIVLTDGVFEAQISKPW